MKLAILFLSSALAWLLSVKYLCGCGLPSGISQTVGYGLKGLEEFLSQGHAPTLTLSGEKLPQPSSSDSQPISHPSVPLE